MAGGAPRGMIQKHSRAVRVLYVSPVFPPAGGIASLMHILLRNGLPGEFCLEVVSTSVMGRKMHAGPSFSMKEGRRNVSILLRLAKALASFRPDIVHFNCSLARTGIFRDLIGVTAARLIGARVVTHYHGSITRFAEGGGLPVVVLHAVMGRSSTNIASNAPDLEYIHRIGRARGETLCLPNYVDADRFIPLERKASMPRARRRGIYVGALTPGKGAFDIVEVARLRPAIDFVLVSASVSDSFRPVLGSLPPNVSLQIDLTAEALRQALGESDFFVFLSHHEGFPLALTEAMCSGLPVVSTNVGSVPEMIDEGKGGFLCAPGDVTEALSALDKLVASEKLLEMGEYNRRKARATYTFDVVGLQLAEIYHALLP